MEINTNSNINNGREEVKKFPKSGIIIIVALGLLWVLLLLVYIFVPGKKNNMNNKPAIDLEAKEIEVDFTKDLNLIDKELNTP